MKRVFHVGLSFFVSACLVILVLQFLNIGNLIDVLRDLDWIWGAVSVCCFLTYQWLRSLRFVILTDAPGGNGRAFVTICIQGVLNNALPAGFGEAALVYLFKKWHAVRYSSGTASLLAARYVDLLIFCTAFVCLSFGGGNRLPKYVYIFTITLTLSLLLFIASTVLVVSYLKKSEARPGLHRGWAQSLIRKMRSIAEALEAIHKKGIWVRVVLYSCMMWFFMYLFFCTTLLTLGISLSPFTIFALYLILLPINVLPVKGIGNFGTHEAAWFIGLTALGLSAGDAALLGFGSHVVVLLVQATTLLLVPNTYFIVRKLRFYGAL